MPPASNSKRQGSSPHPRRNTSKACQACRKRKSKCDGVTPACNFCLLRGSECDYGQGVDRRHSNRPHRRIAELEEQIKRLEGVIATLTNAPSSAAAPVSQALQRLQRESDPSDGPAFELLDLGAEVLHTTALAPALHVSSTNGRHQTTSSSSGSTAANSTASALPSDSPNRPPVPDYHAADSLHIDSHDGNIIFSGPTYVPARTPPRTAPDPSPKWFMLNTLQRATPFPNPFQIPIESHDRLIDDYFSYLNGFMTLIDEESFRRGLADQMIQPPGEWTQHKGYSLFLHMCILSSAAHISTDPVVVGSAEPTTEGRSKGRSFAVGAMSILETEIENRRDTTVHGLVLLCSSMADIGKALISWIISGIAMYVSQDLGLHINSRTLASRGKMSDESVRLREDAFWSVFNNDKLIALFLGRAPNITNLDHDLDPPTFVNAMTEDGLPSIASIRGAYGSLTVICDQVLKLLYSIKRNPTTASSAEVEACKSELRSWPSSLPPILSYQKVKYRPPPPIVLMLHALHGMLTIVFYRPLLQRHCLDHEEGNICFQAGLDVCRLAKVYEQSYTIRKAPITMSQILYTAGSLMVLLLADLYDQQERVEARNKASSALVDVKLYLTSLSVSWSTAQQCLHALNALERDYAVPPASAPPRQVDTAGVEGGHVPAATVSDSTTCAPNGTGVQNSTIGEADPAALRVEPSGQQHLEYDLNSLFDAELFPWTSEPFGSNIAGFEDPFGLPQVFMNF